MLRHRRVSSRNRIIRSLPLLVVLAALVVISQALFDAPLSLGPGAHAIEWVIDPERSLTLIAALFVVRIVATLSTLGGGGSGGASGGGYDDLDDDIPF